MTLSYIQKINEAASFIQSRLGGVSPSIGLVLGSGLGDMANQVEQPIAIDYSEVPHFPVSTVAGHEGRFVIGTLEGKQVIVMQGRSHYYEGYDMQKVVFPVYVMKAIGVQAVVMTNAAEG